MSFDKKTGQGYCNDGEQDNERQDFRRLKLVDEMQGILLYCDNVLIGVVPIELQAEAEAWISKVKKVLRFQGLATSYWKAPPTVEE